MILRKQQELAKRRWECERVVASACFLVKGGCEPQRSPKREIVNFNGLAITLFDLNYFRGLKEQFISQEALGSVSMASLLNPSSTFQLPTQISYHSQRTAFTTSPILITSPFARRSGGRYEGFSLIRATSLDVEILVKESSGANKEDDFGVVGMHHVGILCENLERSLDFYQNILGLEINEARPHDKLPYRGAWLWVGSEMIHLMELPNPDPLTGRPEHGGRDRHTCIAIRDVSKLKEILDKAGIPYTLSRSGRPAIFTRDPDANALEFTQVDA